MLRQLKFDGQGSNTSLTNIGKKSNKINVINDPNENWISELAKDPNNTEKVPRRVDA